LAEGVPVVDAAVDGAGCGAAMRVAPVGIAFRHDPARVEDVAARQARVTHVNALAVDGAVALALAVAALCARGPGEDGGAAAVLDAHRNLLARPEIAVTPTELWTDRARPLAEVYAPRGPSGWTAHAVPAAAHAFLGHAGDFAASVLDAVNGGGDTDSVAAMAGALAGAALGCSAIPPEWVAAVEDAERLMRVADALYELGLARDGV
jgi:ADP-ribosylglycohydrolase